MKTSCYRSSVADYGKRKGKIPSSGGCQGIVVATENNEIVLG